MPAFDLSRFSQLNPSKTFGKPLGYFESTDSTNRLAKEAAAKGAPEGALFLADSQSAGKGRGANKWESEPGANLLFSLILRPSKGSKLSQLTAVMGLAVLKTAQAFDAKAAKLKWPNDLWAEG